MPLIRTTTLGEEIKLYVLPPESAHADRLWSRFTASGDIFGLDVETTAVDEDMGTFDPAMRLRAVQFGSTTEGWMLDPTSLFWRARIVMLLSDNSKRFVSHTNYDILWVLREYGIDLTENDRSIDTFQMAALLRPGPLRPKDLKTLSTLFIDSQLHEAEVALTARFKELAPKGQRVGRKLKAWGFTNVALDDPAFGRYGGLDAVYVRILLDKLAARLREVGMARLSFREQRVARLMTASTVRGHRLDREFTTERFHEVDAEWSAADKRLRERLGFPPGSPRMGAWLEGHGVQFFERTPSGRPKLSKDTLPYLVEQNAPDTEAGEVLRDLHTLSTGKNLRTNLAICLRAADADGFVHPKILTQQAVTGRMSYQSPAMQTFKKGPLRGCFLARPGHALVGADYASQEIRLAAAFSGDPAYCRIVAEGLNQHVLTSELIFPDTFVNKHESPSEYHKAKILDFAQQYGAGPKTIAAQLGIDVREARKLWEAWNEAYAGLVEWSRKLSRYDEVTNPWGRVIPADAWRSYANGNYVIQSSGRDVLGDAIVELDEQGWGDAIWLAIHDELILEVPLEMAHSARSALADAMYAEVGSVELTATAEIIGSRWSGGWE